MTYHRTGSSTAALVEGVGLDLRHVVDRVRTALDEDLAYGPDVTTAATVPLDQWARATVDARRDGVLAGVPVAVVTFDLVIGPGRWRLLEHRPDGSRMHGGDAALVVEAPTRDLLTAERTALNFLGHLSGVATLTAAWAAAVAPARVRDTRKTIPGLRVLDKYAVRCGGGVNHRMGLGDAALVKDNHVMAAGSVRDAIGAVRATAPSMPLEVECDRVSQVVEAIEAGAELILLDNMTIDQLRECVTLGRAAGRPVQFEASGGLTLDTAAAVAATGVDYVAVGALTHSAPVLDLGLDVQGVVPHSVESTGD